MYIAANYNQAQQSAIMHTAGPIQVLAGPGSGKTYTIVKRIIYLIEELKVPPASILVITFTKSAAVEMQSRFLREVRRSYSAVNFGTFHSIYYQILKRSGYLTDYSLITDFEKKKIIRKILPGCLPDNNFEPLDYMEILAEISRLKNGEEDRGQYDNLNEIYEMYQEMLVQMHKIDFDDMIMGCHKLLSTNSKLLQEWQKCFTHILVDEFQDINRLQYRVLKLLGEPLNNLFVVGDDDQSIYGFRGARPSVMKEFIEDFPQCRRVLLNINYRSTVPIVETADKVIRCNCERMEKDYMALRAGEPANICAFDQDEEEENYLIGQIEKLTPDIRNDSAVILRTNYEVSLIALKLTEKGIPIRVREKIRDLFSHFIATDLLDYIYFSYCEPTRARFLNIMNKPMRYISRKAVAEEGFVQELTIVEYYKGNIECLDEVRRFFSNCRRISKLTPYLALNYIRKGMGYDHYLRDKASASEWEEWTETADRIQETSKGCNTFEEWFRIVENHHNICEKSNSQGSKKGEGITLMTMHSSKGLEYHTVFLPHLNEGVLPGKKARTPEQIEEERRLFYVALTRAKERLLLLYTATSKKIPSRFLEPLIQQPDHSSSKSSTTSSNSALSKNSSNASATISYSSSSSI